jgi:hypothetical protein
MTSHRKSFETRERDRQSAWFAKHFPTAIGYKDSALRLVPASRDLNLAPSVRGDVVEYFKMREIVWHQHANHALSSQVCCLNFLAPLTHDPQRLSRLVGEALAIPAPEMLPVEIGPKNRPWFIGFEWIGGNYLNEAGVSDRRTRGANATSADALVRFRYEGRQESLLIEWKYTETYGAPIAPAGNPTRIAQYEKLAFAPEGPIEGGLGVTLTDFFYEPFYQLIRQQMLANQMQKAREDGSERVRVLHISPAANTALKSVTAPALRCFGDDAFSAFSHVLVRPEDFVARSTETLLGPLLAESRGAVWADYLVDRYEFLSDQLTKAQ